MRSCIATSYGHADQSDGDALMERRRIQCRLATRASPMRWRCSSIARRSARTAWRVIASANGRGGDLAHQTELDLAYELALSRSILDRTRYRVANKHLGLIEAGHDMVHIHAIAASPGK
jgi:hypothetical protein